MTRIANTIISSPVLKSPINIQRVEQALPEGLLLAKTQLELQHIRKFKEGYCSDDRPGVHEFHDDGLDPYSYIMYAATGQADITSTARLLLDTDAGFPEEIRLPETVRKMRAEGKRLAELGRLVITENNKLNMLRLYYKGVFEIAMVEDIDVVLIVMKQRNIPSHRKIMAVEVLSMDMGQSWDAEQGELCLVAWDVKADQPKFHQWIDRESVHFSSREWNQYSPLHLGVMVSVQRELYQHTASRLFGNVLDLGCGSGRVMAYVQDNPQVESYTGVDISEDMIRQASWLKEQLQFDKAKLVHAGIENMTGQYDSIFSIHSFYSWPNQDQFLRHIYQLLADNGLFVLVTPNDAFNVDKLSHTVRQELTGHPYYEAFMAINYTIAMKAKAKGLYVPLDNLIAQVRETGFRVKAAHDQFFLGGASYLELGKAL